MRGFLVLFDTQPTAPHADEDEVARRVAVWERDLGAKGVRRQDHPGCRFYLFTASNAIPSDFNQRLTRTPHELLLWVGPRVDMTAPELLKSPPSHNLDELAAETRGSPGALDNAIWLNYRAGPHSLAVKTDVLNSTYVYWTRAGRWLLLSNSSLTLAQIVGAGMDWPAASEFLASGSIYGNHSLYKDIRTLKPATVYVFTTAASPAQQEYWRLDNLPFETLSAPDACRMVVESLDKEFESLNASGKTFILDLTGGYDSRTNLGFALRRLDNFQTTMSDLTGAEDLAISSNLSRYFGFKHTVIHPPPPHDPEQAARLADAALFTDLEYNIVDYAMIYYAQTRFDTLRQPSIHGSAGGDIARNIILRPEYCDKTPEGRLVLEPLIAQRFTNAIPAALSRPDLPIADWPGHMRGRIAEYDVPALPAFARLDILYLRMRMQFWQCRISSSTNRFRASFSPWTNRRVLETMLITRWREKQRQMLSRLLLKALHPDLTRFVVARGEPGGPDWWSAVVAAPARVQYYAGRVLARLGHSGVQSNRATPDIYQHLRNDWEDVLSNMFRPDAVSSVAARDLTLQPHVLGRLLTLAHTRKALSGAPLAVSR